MAIMKFKVKYNILDGKVHFNMFTAPDLGVEYDSCGPTQVMTIESFREFRFKLECPFAHHPDNKVRFEPDQSISDVGHHRAEAVTRSYTPVPVSGVVDFIEGIPVTTLHATVVDARVDPDPSNAL